MITGKKGIMREMIKNGSNQVIGYLMDVGPAIQVFDQHNQLQGQYVKSSDRTFDRTMRLVGYGNQLVRLLGK